MALRNLGIPHEVVAIADIDKYALASYEAIHGDCPNLGDISKLSVDEIPDHDLFTYSFPCQDISVAGRGNGLDEGSNTRSSLLWECRRIIEGKKPSFLLLENVKNLVGKKHIDNFEKWLQWLESVGYKNYWKVLNAKHFNTPQNRERVFVVSIRSDIPINYEFPMNNTVDSCIKDILEQSVDEKFYLNQEQISKFKPKKYQDSNVNVVGNTSATGHNKSDVHDVDGISPTVAARDYKGANQIIVEGSTSPTGHWCRDVLNTEGISRALTAHDRFTPKQILVEGQVGCDHQNNRVLNTDGIYPTMLSVTYKDHPKIMVEGNLEIKGWNDQSKRVYSENGLAPTVHTCQGGSTHPKIIEYILDDEKTDTVYKHLKNKEDIEVGKLIDGYNNRVREDEKTIGTLTTNCGSGTPRNGWQLIIGDKPFRIRRLTPRECWRLMGFSDEDFEKAQSVNSNSQLYKQAGNSIVVNVLEAIFKNLFKKD